eukprot:353000-Chlamydomonas_euryale.AAC.12
MADNGASFAFNFHAGASGDSDQGTAPKRERVSHDRAAAGASVIAVHCAEESIEHVRRISSDAQMSAVLLNLRTCGRTTLLCSGLLHVAAHGRRHQASGNSTKSSSMTKSLCRKIPRLYEGERPYLHGGFKLWEGALDMCRLLRQEFNIGDDLFTAPSLAGKLQGMKVLELGCGHGLPGILCLLAGATVHFQDYNPQVLHELTMPNVRANLARLPPARPRPNARYFSGDWASTGAMLNSKGLGGHYDVILASECIYCTESQYHLLECIKQVGMHLACISAADGRDCGAHCEPSACSAQALQPPMGVAYVAAKVYYFGVGGGTDSFMKLVNSDGIYESKTIKVIEEMSSGNKREVRVGVRGVCGQNDCLADAQGKGRILQCGIANSGGNRAAVKFASMHERLHMLQDISSVIILPNDATKHKLSGLAGYPDGTRASRANVTFHLPTCPSHAAQDCSGVGYLCEAQTASIKKPFGREGPD